MKKLFALSLPVGIILYAVYRLLGESNNNDILSFIYGTILGLSVGLMVLGIISIIYFISKHQNPFKM